MKVEVVKTQTSPVGADQRIVKTEDGRYFCVSGVNAMFTGWEVLVFACDENGEVANYTDVAGGRGISHEEAIEDLEKALDDPDFGKDDWNDD